MLLLAACSTDELTADKTRADVPRDAEGHYVYTMHLAGSTPATDATRASASWADGSVVYLRFSNGGGNAVVTGTATYYNSSNSWTLKANGMLATTPEGTSLPASAVYIDSPGSMSADYVEATPQSAIYATSEATYSRPSSGDVFVKAMLEPYLRRLRFQGSSGQAVTIVGASSDVHFFSAYNNATDQFSYGERDVSLTAGSSAMTPYVYMQLKNPTGDNTLTVKTTTGSYKRTVKASSLAGSNSLCCLIPTTGNYKAAGWESASTPTTETTLTVSPTQLAFDATGGSQSVTVATNASSWTVQNSAMWLSCTVSGTSITVTAQANTAATERTATITISAGGETSTIAVSQQGVQPSPVADGTYTIPGTDVSFRMVLVDGGTFQMGAAPGAGSTANPNESPVRSVTVSSYSIGETEVTQALWQAVMGKNPSSFPSGGDTPVEYVSYNDICGTSGQGTDASCFLYKLNALLASQLGGKKFQLPTEAEWEFAAHGGNRSKGYKYAGGNTLKDVGWYNANSGSVTHPSKQKAANELGLYDMSGNVREWCKDWYEDYYDRTQTNNPTGPASGAQRSVRGGFILSPETNCRITFREGLEPARKFTNLGFRLALK